MEHYYRFLNIAMIIAFISCLVIFNMVSRTKNTAEVTLYYIPDLGLCLVNCFMTFNLRHDGTMQPIFFGSKVTAMIISIGFYINLASAVFYILLALSGKNLIRSAMFEKFCLINNYLWLRFADIMKFKVAATFHAITFKLYFDYLKMEYHSLKST